MIDPDELLDCAERMTDEQKSQFCALIDPAAGDEPEGDPVFGWTVPGLRPAPDNPGPQGSYSGSSWVLREIQFGSLDGGLLLAAATCRVRASGQPVNPVRLMGPAATEFESVGWFTLYLEDIQAPEPVFRPFLERYSQVAGLAHNHLHLAFQNQPAELEVRHCVIAASAPAVPEGALLRVANMTIRGTRLCRGTGVRANLFRPPGPATVAWLLGGWKGGPPQGRVIMTDEVLETVPDIELPDPEPTVLTESARQERWAMAQRRWTQLFHEPKIPMPLADEIVSVALDGIEGMLYDKGVKNQDPVRCACGCGYVIGCVGNKYPSRVKG